MPVVERCRGRASAEAEQTRKPAWPAARCRTRRSYVTIGSLDDPELASIEIQYGLESKIAWVEFCEDVAGEVTGGGPAEQEFFASMKTNQA